MLKRCKPINAFTNGQHLLSSLLLFICMDIHSKSLRINMNQMRKLKKHQTYSKTREDSLDESWEEGKTVYLE